MLKTFNDPLLDEFTMPEPEGLTKWRLHHDLAAYVKHLRWQRSLSPRGRNVSDTEELRHLFNELIGDFGFVVRLKPRWSA